MFLLFGTTPSAISLGAAAEQAPQIDRCLSQEGSAHPFAPGKGARAQAAPGKHLTLRTGIHGARRSARRCSWLSSSVKMAIVQKVPDLGTCQVLRQRIVIVAKVSAQSAG